MTTAGTSVVRVATRGSALARAQTALVVAALTGAGLTADVVTIETSGDRHQDRPVEELSGQGWFTSELESALRDGRVDLAVHSAKDLPGEVAAGLTVAAYLPRADPRDALVSSGGITLDALPPGSRVGTSSPRRAAFVRAANPGVEIVPIRGNVDTRLRKLDGGAVHALLLACAGLDRLGLGARTTERLDPRVFVPSPAQGVIAVEGLLGSQASAAVAAISDAASTIAVQAERAVLAALGGGCLLPLGAWARVEGGELVLSASWEVGGVIRRAEAAGPPAEPTVLGKRVGARLQDPGE